MIVPVNSHNIVLNAPVATVRLVNSLGVTILSAAPSNNRVDWSAALYEKGLRVVIE